MHLADLAPCTYFHGRDCTNLIAFGWLERGREFGRGGCDPDVWAKLCDQCADPLRATMHRGFHVCDLCDGDGCEMVEEHHPRSGVLMHLGNGSIVVPSRSVVFVAPTLVAHYVIAHGYRPPEEVIRAIQECPEFRSAAYWASMRGVAPAWLCGEAGAK
jgi:hypothetical protein